MKTSVSETITQEGNLLLVSLLFGMILMLGYDVFRILRKAVRHGVIALAVEDALYWLACALGIFAMLYQENDGLLRWFVLAGIALGMLMENSWISPWIVTFLSKILIFVINRWVKIWKILGIPFGKIKNFLQKQLKKVVKAIKIGLFKM